MAINLQEVCNILERQTCPIHNKKPTAKVNGNKIEINACCNKFKKELEELMGNEISKQTDDNLDNILDISR
jgi:hypothetical protein